MTGDKRLEPAVRRAVDYSLRAQHPSTGGWRYRVGDTGDTSQLGWQLMSLWSAERAGIKVPPQTWTGAERFLRSVRRGRVRRLGQLSPRRPGQHADDGRGDVLPPNGRRGARRRRSDPTAVGRGDRPIARRAARTSPRQSVLLVLRDAGAPPPAGVEQRGGRGLAGVEHGAHAGAGRTRRLATGRRPAVGSPTVCGAATAAGCTRRPSPRCVWKCTTATRPSRAQRGLDGVAAGSAAVYRR